MEIDPILVIKLLLRITMVLFIFVGYFIGDLNTILLSGFLYAGSGTVRSNV